jgi:hypothetical protein
VQVGEREAAPRGAKHGESGDAVGWVKDRACECGEVEDFLAFGKGSDFDGAVGELAELVVFELGDDFDEVRAAANENGEGPRGRDFLA